MFTRIDRRQFVGVALGSLAVAAKPEPDAEPGVVPDRETVELEEFLGEIADQGELREEAIGGLNRELRDADLPMETILRVWGQLKAQRVLRFASSLKSTTLTL